MNKRIKIIRKSLGLTQERFAEKIGLSRNFIAQIENGSKAPSERTVKVICREFSISESWLRDGIGEMVKKPTDRDASIVSELLEESTPFYDLIKDITETYMTLDDKSRSALDDMIKKLYEKTRKEG